MVPPAPNLKAGWNPGFNELSFSWYSNGKVEGDKSGKVDKEKVRMRDGGS